MIRSLIFLIIEIELDIAFAKSIISYFAKNLSYQHTKPMKMTI